MPLRIDLLHRGARRRLLVDIAHAADGEIERAFAVEGDVAREVAAERTEAVLGDARARARFQRAVLVVELPHRDQVGDVERAVVEGEPVRLVEAGGEIIGLAAMQQRDLARIGLGQEHVAVRRQFHETRMLEAGGEDGDREALGHLRHRAGGRGIVWDELSTAGVAKGLGSSFAFTWKLAPGCSAASADAASVVEARKIKEIRHFLIIVHSLSCGR